MTASRGAGRRALAVGVGIAAALTAVGVVWLSDGGGDCPTEDRRLGVTEGPAGWSAEARYQRWRDPDRCRARIRVALFAPGGTWEDEALAPAGLLEAEVDASEVATGPLTWDEHRIEVAGVVFDVSELPPIEGSSSASRGSNRAER